jgi:hypothetical protein
MSGNFVTWAGKFKCLPAQMSGACAGQSYFFHASGQTNIHQGW